MANRLRELTGYAPWLVLLLAVDGLAVLMLWLANAEALKAMALAIVLATVVPFALVCALLMHRTRRRRRTSSPPRTRNPSSGTACSNSAAARGLPR